MSTATLAPAPSAGQTAPGATPPSTGQAGQLPNITGDILLEAGTNELEVLVFSLRSGWFGVNVAKVREVIRPAKTVEAPHQHPCVIGMFSIRGSVIPVVDLAKSLDIEVPPPENHEGRIIITEFNGLRTGFLVDSVEQIHRVSWSKVRPAPDLTVQGLSGQTVSSTTGIIEMGDRLILMVDFESVADRILLHKNLHVESVANEKGVDRAAHRVFLVEDSPFMRNLMQKVLVASGYTRLEVYSNGEEAWNALNLEGPPVAAVVSDIEMPRIDGLHLTKRIKESERLRGIPVVLFSSLVSQDNIKKGLAVGADVQIPKPELPEVVRLVDRVVSGERLNPGSSRAAA